MTLTSEEFESLRKTTRRFVRERLQPLEEWVEENDARPPEWPELTNIARAMGLYAANVPVEHGGSGLSPWEQVVLWEEFGHVSWPLTYVYCVPNLTMLAASAAQREEYLEPVIAGDRLHCFALTEPDAGSDVHAMTTRARPVDGGWVINGTKHFISRANEADHCIVFAVTADDPSGGRPDITCFVVDADNPGYEVVRRQRMMGWRGMEQNEIVLRDCVVPEGSVIGVPGHGLDLGFELLASARLSIGGYCVGFMERLVDLSIAYARSRVVFGAPLSEKQGIQWIIAEMAIEVEVARATVRSAAQQATDGDVTPATVSAAKYQATRALGRVVDAAVEIHGGTGWCKDAPIERMYRDARVFRLVDGTDEVHQGVVWRHLDRTRR